MPAAARIKREGGGGGGRRAASSSSSVVATCDRGRTQNDFDLDYRVSQQVSDLGWVDFDFGRSTVSPILLGLMRDMLNGQSRWTS